MQEVKQSGCKNLIIDCTYDILGSVLRQAQQVGILSEQHNVIVTSLVRRQIFLSTSPGPEVISARDVMKAASREGIGNTSRDVDQKFAGRSNQNSSSRLLLLHRTNANSFNASLDATLASISVQTYNSRLVALIITRICRPWI